MGMNNRINIVKSLDIPKRQKEEILNLLIIENPYPLGYLPDYIAIGLAIILIFAK